MSLLQIEGKKFSLNNMIWPDAIDCLNQLKKYEDVVDSRIPVNSEIYFKNEEEIIFSTKEEINAQKTAFSAYEQFGIKLLLITNYYYLPKKRLSKEDIFKHSLYVIEKSQEIRYLIFTALLMAKHKELSKISHPIVKNLNKVFAGNNIFGYPSLSEIKDRAGIYKIEM